jgi:hypothetical protein
MIGYYPSFLLNLISKFRPKVPPKVITKNRFIYGKQ